MNNQNSGFRQFLVKALKSKTGILMLFMLVALFAFEMFNYSTTEYSLNDLLGSASFMGIAWATVLAIAFCGIDFAGIARIFTPETDMQSEASEIWYLFGAWLIAAVMNACLTGWGVSLSMSRTAAPEVQTNKQLMTWIPILVAFLVVIIRIFIITALSNYADKLLHEPEKKNNFPKQSPSLHNNLPSNYRPIPRPTQDWKPNNNIPIQANRYRDFNKDGDDEFNVNNLKH